MIKPLVSISVDDYEYYIRRDEQLSIIELMMEKDGYISPKDIMTILHRGGDACD
ncbi:MAG: hypothetical protein SO181_10015 [Frisingicoccus sp.]|uniref:hypothetical protein n=1 Tax=Frisingicoccus sp. TaxID=1918627 RepID=UPI002A83FE15|nr:hypothetical protein [Frisingicoccus sp.]MDY4835461.1 hypothetical protein [Frisingicoccus sp.]